MYDILLGVSKVSFNFLLFSVVQTLFFYFVVSNFPIQKLQEKVQVVLELLNSIPGGNLVIEAIKATDLNEAEVNKQIEEKDKANRDLLYKGVGWIVYLSAALFIGTFIICLVGKKIDRTYFAALLMLSIAYLTEVGVFVIVINRAQYLGTLPTIVTSLIKP